METEAKSRFLERGIDRIENNHEGGVVQPD